MKLHNTLGFSSLNKSEMTYSDEILIHLPLKHEFALHVYKSSG